MSEQADQPLFEIGDRQYTLEAAKTKISAADEHISQIEQENAEMREKLSKAATLDEVLQQFKQQANGNEQGTPAEFTKDDIAKLVQEAVSESSQNERLTNNLSKSQTLMKDKFGEGYTNIMKERGETLGLGPETMRDLAQRSPDAFMKLFDDVKPSTPKPTIGEVNADAVNTGTPTKGTYAYYRQLKKDNPALYNSPSVQNQMLLDAERLGKEAFFGEG